MEVAGWYDWGVAATSQMRSKARAWFRQAAEREFGWAIGCCLFNGSRGRAGEWGDCVQRLGRKIERKIQEVW